MDSFATDQVLLEFLILDEPTYELLNIGSVESILLIMFLGELIVALYI